MSGNISFIEDCLCWADVIAHQQMITFKYKEVICELIYNHTNKKVVSGVIHKNNVVLTLSSKELAEISPTIQEYFKDTGEVIY